MVRISHLVRILQSSSKEPKICPQPPRLGSSFEAVLLGLLTIDGGRGG